MYKKRIFQINVFLFKLRSTLEVYFQYWCNIDASDTDKTWKDTKSNLARKILSVIPEFEENAVYCNIENVHRKYSSKTSKSKYQHLVVVAEFGT